MANNSLIVLKKRSDFENLRKNSNRIFLAEFVMAVYKSNEFGYLRVGWTIPGKVGNAILRNKIKRWSRYYFRNLPESKKLLSFDLNFIYRKHKDADFQKMQYAEFKAIVDKLWKKLQ